MQLRPPEQDLPVPPDADSEERWSPGYACGLLIVAGLILYGSLFPFRFTGAQAGGAVAHLLSTWTVWDQPGDFTANILLYLPLGFCTVQTMPRRAGVLPRILLAALLGAGMAASWCCEPPHCGVQSNAPHAVTRAMRSAITGRCARSMLRYAA